MEIIIPIIFVLVAIYIAKGFFKVNNFSNDIFGMVKKQMNLQQQQQNINIKKQQNYNCNNCDAVLTDPSDISPSGDVKCEFCDTWFNVYQ